MLQRSSKETTMAGLLSRLFGSTTKRAPLSSKKQLELEILEERATPSVSVVKGDIVITQTDANDVCTVKTYAINGRLHYHVEDNGKSYKFDARSRNIRGVVRYDGLYGDDRFQNFTKLPTIADGGYGNDVIVGGKGNDILKGGFGHDRLTGGLGNDTLEGGAGSDALYGSEGNDICRGGDDTDLVDGGIGNDQCYGDAGNDLVYGDFGNDKLFGGAGYDSLYGQEGDDQLDGGVGDGSADRLFGGLGKDHYKGDWVQSGFVALYKNLDAPQDLNTQEGDNVSPSPFGVILKGGLSPVQAVRAI
jgi:Ca2+-binding RTX toxin-like protein